LRINDFSAFHLMFGRHPNGLQDYSSTQDSQPGGDEWLKRLQMLNSVVYPQVRELTAAQQAKAKAKFARQFKVVDEAEQLSLLETRGYTFDCGCTVDRMFPMLSRLPKDDLDYIFEDGHADITCPRCGAKYKAPRELFEQWLAAQPKT
jgi:molecular chaperone Hsp33